MYQLWTNIDKTIQHEIVFDYLMHYLFLNIN